MEQSSYKITNSFEIIETRTFNFLKLNYFYQFSIRIVLKAAKVNKFQKCQFARNGEKN